MIKKILKYIGVALGASILMAGVVTAATILFPSGGGTGTGTAPTSGQLLIGNSGGTYTVGSITAGTNITVTPGSGTITISSTGGGGSGGGTFSTTTSTVAGQLINYPNNTTDIVNIGSNSTTTGKFWFNPNIPSWLTSGVGLLTGGFNSQASSTIGNGTVTGGLTVSGNATTTGDLRVYGNNFEGFADTGTNTFQFFQNDPMRYVAFNMFDYHGLTGTVRFGATIGNVPFIDGAGSSILAIGSGGTIAFDINNNRFGIGTTTPGTSLSIGDTGANTINISETATSTFGRGINVKTGCFAINSVCAGTVSSVATDATLTGGPITTTGTLGINLTNPNSWTGLQQFTNASSTLFSSTLASTTRLILGKGAVGAPSLFFSTGDSTTGFYSTGVGVINVAAGGVNQLTINNGQMFFSGTLIGQGVARAFSIPSTASSLSLPSYSFNGDPNTGYASFGPDMLNLVAGGVETIRSDVASTSIPVGYFGVGTTSPLGLLSVNPNNLAAGVPEFVIGSSTATHFIVDRLGNVGIGTLTPAGNGRFQIVQLVDSNVGGFTVTNSTLAASWRGWEDASGNARIDSGGTAAGSILFNGAGTGKVGIGTTTPGTKLSIGDTGANTINIDNTATSTFGHGVNINDGCFSVAGVCLTSGSAGSAITALTGDVTATGPGSVAATLATVNGNVGSFTNANITVNAKGLITAAANGTAGSGGSGNVSTSTNETSGQVAYWTTTSGTPAKLGSTATSSIASGVGITVTNGSTAYVLGAQPSIACNTASASVFGCLAAADYSKFNSATTTFSTGLTYTAGVVTVNTSQNISTLSNLTTNGFVTTSGSTGALSVTVPGTGVATWIGTPSSANLATAMTDETGTGALVFGTTPSFTTSALFPAGSAAVPGIGIVGDTGTGIYQANGAGSFDFTTSGVWKMGLTAGGSLALGTTTPTKLAEFEVASSSNAQIMITDSNASLNAQHWILSNNDGVFNIGTTSDTVYTSTSTALSLSAPCLFGTCFGIASSTPSAALSIDNASSTQTATQGTPFGYLMSMIINTVRYMVRSFDYYGHQYTSGPAPVISSCGTTPSFVGAANDSDMVVQVGSVSATGCTITFAYAYLSAPRVHITNRSMSVVNAMTYTVSSTAIVITQTGLTSAILDVSVEGTR